MSFCDPGTTSFAPFSQTHPWLESPNALRGQNSLLSAPPQIVYLFISPRIYKAHDQTQPGCLSLDRALLAENPGNQVDPGTKIYRTLIALAISSFLHVKL